MEKISLSDITYEQGLKLLALRKQALDSGHVRRMPPAALANAMPLSRIGASFMKRAEGGIVDTLLGKLNSGRDALANAWGSLDPSYQNVLTSGAVGTGLGALAGAGSGFTSGRGNYLSRALRGGLAGGAIGGGFGIATNPEAVTKLISDLGSVPDKLKNLINKDEKKPSAAGKTGTIYDTYAAQNGSSPGSDSAPGGSGSAPVKPAVLDAAQKAQNLQAAILSNNPEKVQNAQNVIKNMEDTQGSSQETAFKTNAAIGGGLTALPFAAARYRPAYDENALARGLYMDLANPKKDLNSVNTKALESLLGRLPEKTPAVPPVVSPAVPTVPPSPASLPTVHGGYVGDSPAVSPTAAPTAAPAAPKPTSIPEGEAWLRDIRSGDRSADDLAAALRRGSGKPTAFGNMSSQAKQDLAALFTGKPEAAKSVIDNAHTPGIFLKSKPSPQSPESLLKTLGRVRKLRSLSTLLGGSLGGSYLYRSWQDYLNQDKKREEAKDILEELNKLKNQP